MWKWIGGIVLLIVVLVAWRVVSAVKTLTAGGDSTTTTIAASPARVFASLADPDSMAVWMTSATVSSARHGMLQVGDTVRIDQGRTAATRDSSTGVKSNVTWIVNAVTPGQLLALSLQNDSTKQIIATQRDSLVSIGDSTQVITTIGVPIMDSIRNKRTDSSSKVGGAVLDFGSKMMVGAFRKMSEMDRAKLKGHIEGTAVVAPAH
ncbi:MAG TPA: SRPBCC family protein [Gemmatimonadales bacterium]|jgi:uncharacterized protein YndB with AHSA1/START domain